MLETAGNWGLVDNEKKERKREVKRFIRRPVSRVAAFVQAM